MNGSSRSPVGREIVCKSRALLFIVRLRGIVDDVVPAYGFDQDGPVAFQQIRDRLQREKAILDVLQSMTMAARGGIVGDQILAAPPRTMASPGLAAFDREASQKGKPP